MHVTSAFLWTSAAVFGLVALLRAMGVGTFTGLVTRILGGAAVLWVIDRFAATTHVTVGVNPVSAAIVGVLGVPGLLLLGAWHFLLPS